MSVLPVVYLAAGEGRRLRPLTDSAPKALLDVGGMSLAKRALTSLRAAGAEQGEEARHALEADEERRYLLSRTYLNPPGLSGIGTVNTPAWRAAEIPSANAHATPWGITRILDSLGDMLAPATLADAITPHSEGIDFVLGRPSRFGLGFQLTQEERPLGPNPRTFGHFGAGGSLAFNDPDAGLSFAYVLNLSGPRWQNPRNRALIDAVYASL